MRKYYFWHFGHGAAFIGCNARSLCLFFLEEAKDGVVAFNWGCKVHTKKSEPRNLLGHSTFLFFLSPHW